MPVTAKKPTVKTPVKKTVKEEKVKAEVKKKIPVKKKAILIKNISENLHNLWKAFCARRGVSMKDRLEELMREDIRTDRRDLS